MLTHHVDYDLPQPLSSTNPPETRLDYTAVAIATAADLDDENRIEKMILLGRAISAAKDHSIVPEIAVHACQLNAEASPVRLWDAVSLCAPLTPTCPSSARMRC
jgi:hypothetical protein